MKHVTVTCVFLVSCWMLAVQGWSKNVYNLMSVVNGNYDNEAQYKLKLGHDLIRSRAVPVDVPALSGKPVILIDWSANGVVTILELAEISEDENGDLYITVYNFTDYSQMKPLSYDINDLAKLKPEDLQVASGCMGAFTPDGPRLFAGSWPECRHFVNGVYDNYDSTLTCSGWRITMPMFADETSTIVPYDVLSHGDKYPIPNAPSDYVNPCNNITSEGTTSSP